jgi:hypothetical protein
MTDTVNARLLERLQIVSGFPPASLTTARTGDVVCMKGYRRCLVVFHGAIGTAGDDPTITITQATDVAYSNPKALNFTEIYVKMDATHLTDVGQWTKVTQAASNTYTDATSAEQEKVWAIEFKAEDLDVKNDFDCIRAAISDVGTNAQIGALYYILGDPVNSAAPADMLSAIVD